MNEALALAIQTEQDGIAYYTAAAERTADTMGKKMFMSLVADEKRHLAILKKLSCEEDVCIDDLGSVMPKERLRTIFSEAGTSSADLPAEAGDLEALRLAMEMERKGYEQYRRAAVDAKDPDVARIYERLASEENEHWEILQDTLSYLEDTGNWYMWAEHRFPQ